MISPSELTEKAPTFKPRPGHVDQLTHQETTINQPMFTAYNLQQLTTTYNNFKQLRTLFIGTEP